MMEQGMPMEQSMEQGMEPPLREGMGEQALDVQSEEYGDPPIDLPPEDLEAFILAVRREHARAISEMQPIWSKADQAERDYNLEPYEADQLPFLGAMAIRLPVDNAKVDKVAAEISTVYDRDGAPIYECTPTGAAVKEVGAKKRAFFHELLTRADFPKFMRTCIKRTGKVGTGFMVTEIESRPIAFSSAAVLYDDTPEEIENSLVIRCVKVQDMLIAPVTAANLESAAFVGERFILNRWEFEGFVESGFYYLDPETRIPSGRQDTFNGQEEESYRLGISSASTQDLGSDEIDLIKAWVRYKPIGTTRYLLYYCVYPVSRPDLMLRVKLNPYTYLGTHPYTAWNLEEGDGTMFGFGWMEKLRDIRKELEAIHMMRIESGKRNLGSIWIIREGSKAMRTVKSLAGQDKKFDPNLTQPDNVQAERYTRFYPDQIIFTESSDDIKRMALTENTQGLQQFDEGSLLKYMEDATITSTPLVGVRSAFEVKQAADQVAAKLKAYLKVLNSTGMVPMIEKVQAQVWEYLCDPTMIEGVRFMDWGDSSVPITITDFFVHTPLYPAGSTTSADAIVAMTTSASLMSEFIPIIMQVPGVVKDPASAVREILKTRAAALGFQNWEQVFGLSEPTPEDMEKSLVYMTLVQSLTGGKGVGQQGPIMGGDGGAVQGAPNIMSQLMQQGQQPSTEESNPASMQQ